MLAQWLIIDGNNLLYSDPALTSLVRSNFSLARHECVRRMEALLGIMANRITVVFDGTVGGKQTGFESSAVEVQFTAADASADSVIERLSAETDTPTSIAVVSSDRLERYSVESSGVRVLSCRAFLDEVALAQVELQSHIKNFKRKNHTRGTLGDFFP